MIHRVWGSECFPQLRVLAFVLVFQVVPRIVLEAFPAVLLLERKQKEKAIDLIVSECR